MIFLPHRRHPIPAQVYVFRKAYTIRPSKSRYQELGSPPYRVGTSLRCWDAHLDLDGTVLVLRHHTCQPLHHPHIPGAVSHTRIPRASLFNTLRLRVYPPGPQIPGPPTPGRQRVPSSLTRSQPIARKAPSDGDTHNRIHHLPPHPRQNGRIHICAHSIPADLRNHPRIRKGHSQDQLRPDHAREPRPRVGWLLSRSHLWPDRDLGSHHLGRIAVNVGDRIKIGQFVGLSGGDNGDHVHLEVREHRSGGWLQAVDPRKSFLIDVLKDAAKNMAAMATIFRNGRHQMGHDTISLPATIPACNPDTSPARSCISGRSSIHPSTAGTQPCVCS